MKFWVYLKNLLIYYLSAIKYVNTFTSDYLFLEKKKQFDAFSRQNGPLVIPPKEAFRCHSVNF